MDKVVYDWENQPNFLRKAAGKNAFYILVDEEFMPLSVTSI
jgi:hypothetical protein